MGRYLPRWPVLSFVRTCTQATYYPAFEALKAEPYKLDPFVYVQNNPINEVDPTGLQSCNGEWRQQGYDRIFNIVCKCYWLCMPCEGIYWSGNFRELPFTIGSMINSPEGRGAGVRRGDACFCDKPGPDCECN